MVTKYKPFLNIGPGEFIKEELESRNWRQEDLAEILGISLKSVNKLIMNKQSVTIETARLLSKAFGQSPQYWMNLDTDYRLRLQTESSKEKEVEIKSDIYKHMPVKEMIKKGWIKLSKTIDSLISEIKLFWGIPDLDFSFLDERVPLNFRKSGAFDHYNKYYALTWFRMAQRCAKICQVSRYEKGKLENLAKNLYRYTTMEDGVKTFLKDLSNAGVKFLVLGHLQKTYIDGASFFDDLNPVIVYTARHDRNDNFWFTIAHEIAHIILHLRRKDDFCIDSLDDLLTSEEEAANKYAEKILKVTEILEYFKPYQKYISRDRVTICAEKLLLNPAVVVGILQHHNILLRRNLNDFKHTVSDLIPQAYLARPSQFEG
ncbi:MAG: addiction module antidote protein, HigA family [Candidatus Brocadia sp.]|nr:HigA family addiction module antidote protein [Candidatus Brocadia sp.]MDG6026060.1 addiction module antidote protein, HigA family [Candidatus Brocadia sp.]